MHFITPKDDWKMILEGKKNCHWFVDELAAMYLWCSELYDAILSIANERGPEQLFWITIDFAQKFNSFRPFCDHMNIKFIEG